MTIPLFNIVESITRLLERCIFEVASHRSLSDEYVHQKPVGWLFSQFWMVQRSDWVQWTGLVTATQIGVSRTLSQMLSTRPVKLPELPSFDELMGPKEPQPEVKRGPSLVQRIEAANQTIRQGQSPRRQDRDLPDTDD